MPPYARNPTYRAYATIYAFVCGGASGRRRLTDDIQTQKGPGKVALPGPATSEDG